VANLDVIERDRLIEGVRETTGPRLEAQLSPIAAHPLVGEARRCGLIAGLELVVPGTRRERFPPVGRAGAVLRDACLEAGLVVRAIRDGIALCPPLSIRPEEIDELGARLRTGLDRAAERLADPSP
jgi:putrescine aminotransferase